MKSDLEARSILESHQGIGTWRFTVRDIYISLYIYIYIYIIIYIYHYIYNWIGLGYKSTSNILITGASTSGTYKAVSHLRPVAT